MDVTIIGAGIAGLTLALDLHRVGIGSHIYEAAPELAPIGVGINLLPHCTAVLADLDLDDRLAEVAVTTAESAFYNGFGQFIYAEPAGRAAGHAHPQYSIHRGELHAVLLDAVRERVGAERIHTGHTCLGVDEQDDEGVMLRMASEGREFVIRADVVVACDGVHSRIRKQMHPAEGDPLYSGVTMWRGTTVMPPFLTGASMVRAGWLSTGKMVIYPIRDLGDGSQLVNWVAEIETPRHIERDWNRLGSVDDFADAFADWTFDWLDVPAMIRGADQILEYPMVDQDPLDHWTEGLVTLMGDAAHPMVPRGSNGAGQAILDVRCLADLLADDIEPAAALHAYEAKRLPFTAHVVRTNRTNPPDAILREVFDRTGNRPFDNLDDVIGRDELRRIADNYRRVVGIAPQATAS